MPEYRVTWVIDLTADSPEAAARRAQEIQLDPDSIATVFDIIELLPGQPDDLDDAYGQEVTVDLWLLDSEEED